MTKKLFMKEYPNDLNGEYLAMEDGLKFKVVSRQYVEKHNEFNFIIGITFWVLIIGGILSIFSLVVPNSGLFSAFVFISIGILTCLYMITIEPEKIIRIVFNYEN